MAELQGKPLSLDELAQKELEAEGETNNKVEGSLVNGARLDVEEEGTCQLCKVTIPVYESAENIYFQNDDFYIVETYTKKNHEVRNMVSFKEHGRAPPVEESSEALDRLAETTATHIGDGEMMVYGSMNSFSGHFHLVASDVHGENSLQVDDREQINSFAKFVVEDGEIENYQEGNSRYRDNFGEYLEEWTEHSNLDILEEY